MEKIPEIKLVMTAESEEAKKIIGFKLAREGIGNRSKIGGDPDWIQKPEKIMCACGKEMLFFCQIDSIGEEFSLADAGMLYSFICQYCWVAKSIIQSY